MSWIENKIKGLVINRIVKKVVTWLDGKKTIIGLINIALWAVIYAVPVVAPQHIWVVAIAQHIKDALESGGIVLDGALFNAGLGFTVVGLIDKIRKLIKKDK